MTARKPGQWWDETWSPVTGCTPAGAGCAHCHALARMRRHLPALRGEGNADAPATTVLCHGDRLQWPLKWKKPRVVLTCMMGDLFHKDVPSTFIDTVLVMMRASAQHTYCVLTKRWERAARHFQERWPHTLQSKSILMASVATQSEADAACSALSRLRGVRWGLHVEPMLGPIDLSYQHPGANGAAMGDVSWIVVGAEQGPGARPFELDWARSLRDQCRAASVPFWFKSDSRRREPPTDLCVRETPWR